MPLRLAPGTSLLPESISPRVERGFSAGDEFMAFDFFMFMCFYKATIVLFFFYWAFIERSLKSSKISA